MLRVRVEAIKGHRMALPVGLVCKSTAIIAMEAKTGKKCHQKTKKVIRKQRKRFIRKQRRNMSHEGNRDNTIKDNFLNHILKLSYHLTSQIANAIDITESKPVFPVTSSTFEIKTLFHALEIHFILLKTKRCILKAGQKFLRLKRLQKEGEQKSRLPIDRHTPKSRRSKPRWWGPSLCRPAVVHTGGGCQRRRRPFVGHVSFWRVQKLLVLISFTWIFLLIDTGRPGQTDKDTHDSEKKTNTLPDNIKFAFPIKTLAIQVAGAMISMFSFLKLTIHCKPDSVQGHARKSWRAGRPDFNKERECSPERLKPLKVEIHRSEVSTDSFH